VLAPALARPWSRNLSFGYTYELVEEIHALARRRDQLPIHCNDKRSLKNTVLRNGTTRGYGQSNVKREYLLSRGVLLPVLWPLYRSRRVIDVCRDTRIIFLFLGSADLYFPVGNLDLCLHNIFLERTLEI